MSSKRGHEIADTKKRKHRQLRLRCIVRSVLINKVWLSGSGDQKLSLNVKKNIAMLVRTQRKLGILTLNEKTLLRTHAFYRSIEDRRKLTSFMASLTCLSKFSPKIRARLASVVKFLNASKGRKIIKEGNFPETLYFVLSGEVEISKKVFDPIQNAYVDKAEFLSGPGDCFGDAEMLENIRRRHTYTVTSEVELLVVIEDDFDRILRPVMSKQWSEKKTAIKTLHYFSFFTYDQLITACQLGMLRQFEPLETICYEDKGQASYAYFVLSGECMILQCLQMRVSEKDGKKSFDLVDISKDGNASIFQGLTNAEFMQQLKQQNYAQYKDTFDIDQEILSIDNIQNEEAKKKALLKTDLRSVEISCGFKQSTESLAAENTSKGNVKATRKFTGEGSLRGESVDVEDLEGEVMEEILDEDLEETVEGVSLSTNKSKQSLMSGIRRSVDFSTGNRARESLISRGSTQKRADSISNSKVDRTYSRINENTEQEFDAIDINNHGEEQDQESMYEFDEVVEQESSNSGDSRSFSVLRADIIRKQMKQKTGTKIENHFIDVGSLTYSGIFGLGEKLEHRVIMARTTVQCLMLPRFWLFERNQNPGNVWQRRRFYLDCTIPSRQKLFRDFLLTRRWQKFKNDFIQSNLNKNSMNNPTKDQDVPIICRIVEAHD